MSLRGRRVVVTRAPHQAGELVEMLHERGAEALLYPCIAIAPPPDSRDLDQALRDLCAGAYDWLLLTSANTVEALSQRAAALNFSLAGLHAAAVGPATANSARERLGLDVSIVAEEHISESLAASLNPAPGTRLLLPQADLAPQTLAHLLRDAGASVRVVTVYQTVIGQGGVNLPALLRAGQVDALTFTSSSTVRNGLTRLRNEGGHIPQSLFIACIGPKTARTAAEAGLTRLIVPDDYTLAAMLDALDAAFVS